MNRKMISLLMTCVSVIICALSMIVWIERERMTSNMSIFDPSSLLTILAALIVSISFAWTYVTIFQKDRTNTIFISYQMTRQDEAKKIMWKYKGRIFSSTYTISAGEPILKSLRREIQNASFCIVLIDDEVSKSQVNEIKLMKHFKKRIIPVLISSETIVPSVLSGIKCITFDEFMKR